MTEISTTDQGTSQAVGAGAESIDLLMRHLEAAKQIVSMPVARPSGDDGELEAFPVPDVLCTLLYAQPGTFCPLLYLHHPYVVEK